MIYKELNIPLDIEYLQKVFDDHKEEKLSQYKIKNVKQEILGTRDYYEMYFSFKEGKDLFFDQIPLECRGYQFVYMPPNYEMVVHKDISYLKCRIGCILQGNADILFYDEDNETVIDKHDYSKPILTNVQVPHNVANNDNYRLTFFANFEQEFDDVLTQLNQLFP